MQQLFIENNRPTSISLTTGDKIRFYSEIELESLIKYVKELNYMDGSKTQYQFSPKEIFDKWNQAVNGCSAKDNYI